MGVCLGHRGIHRATLRGILVGAFEGAAFPGLIKAAASQSDWLKLAVVLMWANSLLFWTGAMFGSGPSDIFTQTEEVWQKTVPRRAFIRRIIRLTLHLEDLKGESIPVGILVHAIRWLWLPLLLTWGAWAFTGENPLTLLKDYLVRSK